MIAGRRIPWLFSVAVAAAFALLLAALYYRDFYAPTSLQPVGNHALGGDEHVAIDFDHAHKLPSADAFMSQHFERVFALPGLGVNETKATCTWGKDDKVNYMFGADVEWNVEDRPYEELDLRRRELQDFVRHRAIPWSQVKSRFSGRGIVVLSGNGDTLLRTKVLLRALKRLKSELPVEIHYWDHEMNRTSKEQLLKLYPNTFFNDLSGDHNLFKAPFRDSMINYQLKTASIVNSQWAEVILLDSDNIPVFDPAELWDSPTYKEYGTIFWPDIARTRAPNPAWAITNTPCRMDEYELESGQLVMDKARFWYHVQLAAHMNTDPDRYYDTFLLGDKDTFRFAWHALKTRFGRPRRWLTSIGTQNGDVFCGHTFAQHHPDDGRIAFLHGGLFKTISPPVMRWNRDVKGGLFRHYKRAASDEDPARLVDCGLKWDSADYVPGYVQDVTPDWSILSCADMYDTESRDLDEILPGYEQTFRELGGYWLIDESSR